MSDIPVVVSVLLPTKSKETYLKEYELFKEWLLKIGSIADKVTDDTAVAYIAYMIEKKYAPATMYKKWSCVARCLDLIHGLKTRDLSKPKYALANFAKTL